MADWIEFHLSCNDCGGLGINFNPSECPHCPECDGKGYVVRGDFYNSMKKAKKDYPNAIKMTVIR